MAKRSGETFCSLFLVSSKASTATVETEDELPEVTESNIGSLSDQERKDYSAKLKAAGNKAYGSKDYMKAIDLYGQALLCKADPVFYSNRAACWNAMSNWDKVIEDTTAALNLDNEYVKALNRRANAYEQSEKYSEALLDYTASCIIDGFRNDQSAQAVERLLKKVADSKAGEILKSKQKKLPSPTFVTNYLQSFRPKDLPEGLATTDELEEESGKGQLRKGLQAIQKRTGDGYTEAAEAFTKALELGGLDEHEALAYNMRGTFKYLKGEDKALDDLNKSSSWTSPWCRATSSAQACTSSPETVTMPKRTLTKQWSKTTRIQIFTTTEHNCTSSFRNSERRPRTTKSPLISTRHSSFLTFNWVSPNTRWAAWHHPWLRSAAA